MNILNHLSSLILTYLKTKNRLRVVLVARRIGPVFKSIQSALISVICSPAALRAKIVSASSEDLSSRFTSLLWLTPAFKSSCQSCKSLLKTAFLSAAPYLRVKQVFNAFRRSDRSAWTKADSSPTAFPHSPTIPRFVCIAIIGLLLLQTNGFSQSCSKCKEVEFELFANMTPNVSYQGLNFSITSVDASITIQGKTVNFSPSDYNLIKTEITHPNGSFYTYGWTVVSKPKKVLIKPFKNLDLNWSGSISLQGEGGSTRPLSFYLRSKNQSCYQLISNEKIVTGYYNGAFQYSYLNASQPLPSFSISRNPNNLVNSGSVGGIQLRPSEKGGNAGSGGPSGGSVSWYSTFGNNPDGSRIGSLNLYEENITDALYTPSVLISTVNESTSSNQVIRVNNLLRQIKTLQSFADIVTISPTKYEIRYYLPSQVGTLTSGLYPVTGTPIQTWIFEKPASSTTTKPQVLISSIKGTKTETFLATQDLPNNAWTYDSENGQKIESHQTIENIALGTREETYTTSEKLPNNTIRLLSKTVEKYKTLPWGSQELYESIKDPDGANLITRYFFYETESDTANYSQLKAVVNPDGSWEKYVYYPTNGNFFGREWKTYRPYLSSPATYDQATDTNCKVTEVQYGFFNSIFPEYTSFEKETINGVITSQKSYQMYEENYTAPNGQLYNTVVKNAFSYYGPALAQYTWEKSQTYSKTATGAALSPSHLQGKTAAISYPDGRNEIFWYEPGTWNGTTFTPSTTGTAWRDTVTHARTAAPTEVVNQTTRSVTIRDNLAYLVREEEQIYTGTGYQLLSRTDYTNDSEGNPLTITKDGRVIQTNIYTNGQKTSETDETGILTEYTYDDLGNQLTSTKKGVAAGTGYQAQPDLLTTYTYDATGRQTGQTIAAGSLTQTTSSTYDKAGRIESETTNGLTTWHAYLNGGLIHRVTSPNGATQITETYFDGKTKSVTGTGVVSQFYSYAIDSTAAQLGFQSTTIRTGSDTDPQFETTTQDLLGRTVLLQRPGFNSTTWQQQSFYNDLGQLVKVSQTGSADQLTTYNSVGELLRSGLDIDGDGVLTPASTDRFTETTTDYAQENSIWYRITTTKQYLKDNLATVTTTLQKEALGGTPESITRDPLGNLTRITTSIDRTNKTVTQTTDTADSSIDALSVTVNGLLVKQSSNTNAAFALFGYDSLGRQAETVQQDGVTTSQAYDSNGQMISQTDAAGNTTTISYYAQDELGAGQPKLVTQPDSTTILYEYDFRGNKTREWGSATYPVDYEYNSKNQRTKMFTYRSLTSVGNKAQGDATTWSYDPATGLLISKTDAATKATTYTYHPSGQLKTRTWARGVTTTYSYNLAGELTIADYSDTTPDLSMTFDRSGQPIAITDGSGTRSLSSTTTGLPLGYSYNNGLLNGLGVTNTFDSLGRLDSITAGGRTTNYSYRSEGRLGTVLHQGSTATYGYKPNSDLLQTTTFTHGGGTRLTTTRSFDTANRVLSVVNTPGTGSNGSNISRTYEYNSRNQRTKATLPSGENWNYGYNSKGEVTAGVKKNSANTNLLGHEYAYNFDEIGSRISTTTNGQNSAYVANELNQYNSRTVPPVVEILGVANAASNITVNNQSVQRQGDLFFTQIPVDNSAAAVYLNNTIVGVRNNADAAGNDAVQQSSVKKIVPKTPEQFTYGFDGNVLSDGRWNYTWDGENRLNRIESVSSAPSADKKRIDFIYDGQSRRVSKKSYTWNGSAWVFQDSRRFLYDQFNLLAEVNDAGTVINSYAWGTDLSGSMYGAGGVGGLLINGASTASATSYPSYDANGNILAYVSNTGAITAQFEYGPFGEVLRATGYPPSAFGFSTKYRDSETGLNYYGYRYYSANLGRWLGRDPIGELGGLNLNSLSSNDLINQYDAYGLIEPSLGNFIAIYRKLVELYAGNAGRDQLGLIGVRRYWNRAGNLKLTRAQVKSIDFDGLEINAIRHTKIDLAITDVITKGKESDQISDDGARYYTGGGNGNNLLGTFYVVMSGKVTCHSSGYKVEGKFKISDRYDFDIKLKEYLNKELDRSFLGQIKTIIARILIPGSRYEVTSEDIPFTQTADDKGVAKW